MLEKEPLISIHDTRYRLLATYLLPFEAVLSIQDLKSTGELLSTEEPLTKNQSSEEDLRSTQHLPSYSLQRWLSEDPKESPLIVIQLSKLPLQIDYEFPGRKTGSTLVAGGPSEASVSQTAIQ